MSTRLLAAQHGGVLTLTLESEDRYPRLDLDRDLMAALDSEIARVARSSNIVGAVITGSDRAFAAGADISEIAQLTPADAFEFSRLGRRCSARSIGAKSLCSQLFGATAWGAGLTWRWPATNASPLQTPPSHIRAARSES